MPKPTPTDDHTIRSLDQLKSLCGELSDASIKKEVPFIRDLRSRTAGAATGDAVLIGHHVAMSSLRAITADGLTLEPQTQAHADEMFVVLGDPAIYAHEGEPPASPERLRERFRKLESRTSPDGRQQWLNWVIRLPSSQLAGYVQATVFEDGRAAIAYEMASAHWGRGIARRAVQAMMDELVLQYRVSTLVAIAKQSNVRSIGLLTRLGFAHAPPAWRERHAVGADEVLMTRPAMPTLDSAG